MTEKLSEKERLELKLEALLLEGQTSGEPTVFIKADFEAIRQRGLARLKNKAKK